MFQISYFPAWLKICAHRFVRSLPTCTVKISSTASVSCLELLRNQDTSSTLSCSSWCFEMQHVGCFRNPKRASNHPLGWKGKMILERKKKKHPFKTLNFRVSRAWIETTSPPSFATFAAGPRTHSNEATNLNCEKVYLSESLVGGWTNPSEKCALVKLGSSSPNFPGEN